MTTRRGKRPGRGLLRVRVFEAKAEGGDKCGYCEYPFEAGEKACASLDDDALYCGSVCAERGRLMAEGA